MERRAREPVRDKVEIRVQFSKTDCGPCPVKDSCTRGPRRKPTLQDRAIHEVLHQRRAEQKTDAWKERYKTRAGVEGTISRAVNRCGLRGSRYRGLAKTSLQHQLAGAAINLARIDAHLTGVPRARTRTSHFAALRPADHMIDGAKQTTPN
ncbi:transposase [Streptomyces sp. NPDC058459]|uniref:transposase n=1 Tax=Streptomyces sp. NPDC058459 TaxID=3346508 RepID=UPI003662FED2